MEARCIYDQELVAAGNLVWCVRWDFQTNHWNLTFMTENETQNVPQGVQGTREGRIRHQYRVWWFQAEKMGVTPELCYRHKNSATAGDPCPRLRVQADFIDMSIRLGDSKKNTYIEPSSEESPTSALRNVTPAFCRFSSGMNWLTDGLV